MNQGLLQYELPFLPKTGSNLKFVAKNSVFLAWGVSSRTLTLICSCSTPPTMRCTVWDQENSCFKAAPAQKHGQILPKMA